MASVAALAAFTVMGGWANRHLENDWIAPALTEAYQKILPVEATYRHILLLTDGISEEGNSYALAREAKEHQVTISTIGLGDGVSRAVLQARGGLPRGRSVGQALEHAVRGSDVRDARRTGFSRRSGRSALEAAGAV